ncbi:hypothetical protein [Mycoplasmopsis cynos]|nr:hypothetical protein [Mycoplasmopsis cynos]UWV77187.1 hypothetical protein NW070_05595 [Mycoplasmopsis cynos]
MSEYKIFSVVAGSYEVHNTKTNEISFLKGARKIKVSQGVFISWW